MKKLVKKVNLGIEQQLKMNLRQQIKHFSSLNNDYEYIFLITIPV